MDPNEDLNTAVRSKLNARLKQHISEVDLNPISRIPMSRLQQTALKEVGLIELVLAEVFVEHYDDLYTTMFHGGERERSDLIVSRLRQDFAGLRIGLAPYRIIGIRDNTGRAAAGAQFSVLFLPGGQYAVPYLQYVYVSLEKRRRDLSELLHTLVIAVSMADAAASNRQDPPKVPFTLFETEPPSHGIDDAKRAIATERTSIHAKSGSLSMMLQAKNDRILSPHVQPGLEIGDPPLTLIWALRANPTTDLVLDSTTMGPAVLKAYYQSLRDEGFPEENIALAERIAESRSRGCDFRLIPLAEVTRAMYVDID